MERTSEQAETTDSSEVIEQKETAEEVERSTEDMTEVKDPEVSIDPWEAATDAQPQPVIEHTQEEYLKALMLSAKHGYLDKIELLVKEHGVDVNVRNAHGYTALMLAAAGRQSESVRVLLEKGADAALTLPDGKTALDLARDIGAEEVIRALES
ncbi:MAG: ankyrin repeat domain-containing protein [Motiliproteus sp.]